MKFFDPSTWSEPASARGDPVADIKAFAYRLRKQIGLQPPQPTLISGRQYDAVISETCPCGAKWSPCCIFLLVCDEFAHMMTGDGVVHEIPSGEMASKDA